MEEWNFYWDAKKRIVGDDNMPKCFAFVECLPEEDKARAKCFIIKEHVSFEVLVDRFNEENHGLLPR